MTGMEKRRLRLMRLLPGGDGRGLFVGNAIDTRGPVAISGNLHFVKIKCGDIGGRHCAWPV
jgi:hypothetical protein